METRLKCVAASVNKQTGDFFLLASIFGPQIHPFMIYRRARKQSRILAFFQEFFSEGAKTYCYASFFCDANFSIVFGPNFGGAKVSEGGKLPRGGRPPNPCGRKPEYASTFLFFVHCFTLYTPLWVKVEKN